MTTTGYYHYYYYYYFSHKHQLRVFLWSLSESKSTQISRTLPSILVNLNRAVVWMVSTRVLISNSTNPLETVPSAPITIAITVTSISYCFFSFLARSKYLSLFLPSFNFTLWSARTQSPQWDKFSVFLLIITSPGHLVEIRWFVCIEIPENFVCLIL